MIQKFIYSIINNHRLNSNCFLQKKEEKKYSVTLEQIKASLRGIVEGESKLKRLMLNKLHPLFIFELDKEIVRQAGQKIGKFYKL